MGDSCLSEPAQRQQNVSTIQFALSNFYCRGVSHEKNSIFGRFSSLLQGPPPLKSETFIFIVVSPCLKKKGLFGEKGGSNSVNERFGKDFYRKGNSVKRSGPFNEPPHSEN